MAVTCPIWLVVGFLGAGKTTLLRRLVRSPEGSGLAYVINEFSAVDVDAALVEREGGLALAVAGGSIFCRCLVSAFVDVLRRVSEGVPARDGTLVRPEGVVVEASGMADPRSMRRLLAESGLDARFHVAGVTAVVDPGTLMKLLLVLPNIRGQIESADLILLNKTDLHAPETVAAVRTKLASINPHAAVIRCTHGAHAAGAIRPADAALGQTSDLLRDIKANLVAVAGGGLTLAARASLTGAVGLTLAVMAGPAGIGWAVAAPVKAPVAEMPVLGTVEIVDHRKQRLDDALAGTQQRVTMARFEPLASVLEVGLRPGGTVLPGCRLSERLFERCVHLVAAKLELGPQILS